MSQIFLCHSHKDKSFVRRLARNLSDVGIDVWLDEWELTPGDSLHGCIGEALNSVAYVGVVMSPNSIQSKWCQSELHQALSREIRTGKKIVVPLLYRRVQAPAFLEDRLYANFSKHFYSALTQLAGLIYNLDSRKIAQLITNDRPRNLDSVKSIIESTLRRYVENQSSKQYYQATSDPLSGTSYGEVRKKAHDIYTGLTGVAAKEKQIRSAYFGEKVNFNYFWKRVSKLSFKDRVARIRFLPCAVELIRNATTEPFSKKNPNRPSEIVHRFVGITRSGRLYFVHVMEDTNTGKKYLLSVFPMG